MLEVVPRALEERLRRVQQYRQREQQTQPIEQAGKFAAAPVSVPRSASSASTITCAVMMPASPRRRSRRLRSPFKQQLAAAGIVRVGEVADLGDGPGDVAELEPALVPAYAQPVGGVIHLYTFHARQPRKVVPLTATQAAQVMPSRISAASGTCSPSLRTKLFCTSGGRTPRSRAETRLRARAQSGRVAYGSGTYSPRRTVYNRLCDRLATATAHRPACRRRLTTQVSSRRQRQAAVESGGAVSAAGGADDSADAAGMHAPF